jgi:hypothetical protein
MVQKQKMNEATTGAQEHASKTKTLEKIIGTTIITSYHGLVGM